MSWRSCQGQSLTVNNLTVLGKLTYDSDSTDIVLPTEFTVNTLESPDKTNKIIMSTPNEIDLNSTKVKLSNDLSVTGTADSTYYHCKGKTNLLSQAKTQGSYFSWNETGQGQMDLICNKGLGLGGLNFYVQDTNGSVADSATPLLKVDGSGNETITGYNTGLYYHAKGKTNLLSQAKDQGTYISWNESGGTGETDIICNKGGGSGGFNFYIQDTSGSVADGSTPLLKLTNSGSTIQGNLTVTGTLTSSNTTPQQEFKYVQVTGNADNVSATVQITGNNSTNYAVFPTIYYGYSGSSGTYNVYNTSSAIKNIIISEITKTSFTFNLNKNNGDNVNVYIMFMIVYSSAFNYPKSY